MALDFAYRLLKTPSGVVVLDLLLFQIVAQVSLLENVSRLLVLYIL